MCERERDTQSDTERQRESRRKRKGKTQKRLTAYLWFVLVQANEHVISVMKTSQAKEVERAMEHAPDFILTCGSPE